jgi:hypothetical protein
METLAATTAGLDVMLERLPQTFDFGEMLGHMAELAAREGVESGDLHHHFTPGLYARELRMRAGSFMASKIHQTIHPFCLSAGAVVVWGQDGSRVFLRAPYFGVTQPATQRFLLIVEDAVWTTFHPTTETDLEKLEQLLVRSPVLKLGGGS